MSGVSVGCPVGRAVFSDQYHWDDQVSGFRCGGVASAEKEIIESLCELGLSAVYLSWIDEQTVKKEEARQAAKSYY